MDIVAHCGCSRQHSPTGEFYQSSSAPSSAENVAIAYSGPHRRRDWSHAETKCAVAKRRVDSATPNPKGAQASVRRGVCRRSPQHVRNSGKISSTAIYDLICGDWMSSLISRRKCQGIIKRDNSARTSNVKPRSTTLCISVSPRIPVANQDLPMLSHKPSTETSTSFVLIELNVGCSCDTLSIRSRIEPDFFADTSCITDLNKLAQASSCF